MPRPQDEDELRDAWSDPDGPPQAPRSWKTLAWEIAGALLVTAMFVLSDYFFP